MIHKIKIKHLLTDEITLLSMIELCNSLIEQLSVILKQYEHSDGEDDSHIFYTLEDIIDNFNLLSDEAKCSIHLQDKSYDLENQFNSILNDLYTLGNSNKLIRIV
jgi:uncharacterized membrane protein